MLIELIVLLTTANSVKWYMDCASKSSGPTRKMVPSVFSVDTRRCLIANRGDPCERTVFKKEFFFKLSLSSNFNYLTSTRCFKRLIVYCSVTIYVKKCTVLYVKRTIGEGMNKDKYAGDY